MSVLPKFFHESICHCNGYDETLIEQAHQQAAPISIRLNPYKPTKLNFELDCAVAHSNFGFYINHKPEFTYDINFQAGAYYVQEASSMFIEYVIRQTIDLQKQLTVLDACAAPGGKTTLINSLINSESVLVCNEIEKSRVGALMQNITKWGTHNSIVTNNDTNVFQTLPNMFDLALIDAPCSGSGLFRKMPNYINDWNMNFVNQSFIRQKNILTNIIPSIKEGGILIYSTCSYHIEENENIMDWICDNFNLQNIAIEMPNSFGILESKSKHSQNIGYRCYPYNMKGEGFFCAVFKKQSNENSMPKKKTTFFN